MKQDTNVEWSIRIDETSKEVHTLAPGKPVRVGDAGASPEQMARAFFDRYRRYLHGTGQADELRVVRNEVDADGSSYVRFEHFVPGTNIQLLNVASTASFTKTGELYMSQPSFRRGLDKIASTPAIAQADATKRAIDRAVTACNIPPSAAKESFKSKSQLAVRADDRLPLLLVWRVLVGVESGPCTVVEALIDAKSGEVVSFNDTAIRD